jgi:lysyl-tRNA synthetase class 1
MLHSKKIIGKGTWLDNIASKIIEREKKIKRSLEILRVESGLGASGLPHIGSFSDAIRAYGIKLALENNNLKSELIAFSDDMDGLRKVPKGFPRELTKYMGIPVSMIPDPFNCHQSYGNHMSSLLCDALDKCNIKYTFRSGTETYRSGILNNQIAKILEKAEIIGKKISESLGQTKFKKTLPYFPICQNCGKIYVAEAKEYLPKEKKVLYNCLGSEIGGRLIEGCHHEGEISILDGTGKLSWKTEFAARWAAQDIRFEAYGKDIADSVKINDWISDRVLAFPHPYHIQYEMFLDQSGKKISKSAGNVFTPQTWLRYGSPKSLLLLMFKRVIGTRSISIDDIPKYMDEFDLLENIYFGKVKIDNPLKLARLKGLYEYVNLLSIPQKPRIHVPYDLLVQLISISPALKRLDYISNKLISYGIVKENSIELSKKIELTNNWAKDFKTTKKIKVHLTQKEANAIKELIKYLESNEDHENIQSEIFNNARRNEMEPKNLFRIIYQILIGTDRGPRLGRYIVDIGKANVIDILKKQIT